MPRTSHRLPWLLAPLLLALAPAARADSVSDARSFRCKQDLVNLGDSRAVVVQRCGEPARKDSFCAEPAQRPNEEPRRRPVPCVTVDEWTYNPGYGQFWTTLRFEGGQLVSIRYGDRVR